MQRADLIRDLVVRGTETSADRCRDLAAELGLLVSDVLTIAGHPVPPELLPPDRDARVFKAVALKFCICDHETMPALLDFIRDLPVPALDPTPRADADRKVFTRPDAGHFARILDGFLRNRGFTHANLPFMGLARSTIVGAMLSEDHRSEHRWFQLSQMAGPLGWRFEDFIVVADEPRVGRLRYAMHCHHAGELCVAAVPLSTEQLVEVGKHADRLNARRDPGILRQYHDGFAKQCPDISDLVSQNAIP